MTVEQERSLIDNPLYLEKHDRQSYEMLAEQGIRWHPFCGFVIFESPYHNMENENPLLVLEFTLFHRAAEDSKPKAERSLAGLLRPDGKPADIPISVPEEPLTLKEKK